MPKASSFSPLRLFTPIQLMFCLLLFFLPWIDIQCVIPAARLKNMSKQQLENHRTDYDWDPSTPFSYASQSGFQIATGEASPGSDMRRALEKQKKLFGGGDGGQMATDPGVFAGRKKKGATAPFLMLYPLAVLGGVIVGFVLGPGSARRITLLSVCLGALVLVGLHAVIGFPVERQIKELAENDSGMGLGGFGGMGGFGGGNKFGGDRDDKQSTPKVEDVFRVTWQIPLYLTLLLLLGAACTSVLDGGPGTKARRNVYDFDEDDDDDRPRRKRSRVDYDDDDDEDEPPRKHKRKRALSMDDEDEEERSKKKRRRADDDED
jgi:hypothetical protein